MSPRPLLLGHRGARAVRGLRENTIESFDRALADGCDGFEFDVRLTADGEAVIWHDPESGGKLIEEASADQLPQLARLEDVLSRYRDSAFLDIELKVAGLENIAIDLLRRFPPRRGCVVSSFIPGVLEAVRALDAGVSLGLICETKAELSHWRRLALESVILHHDLLDPALAGEIESCREKTLRLDRQLFRRDAAFCGDGRGWDYLRRDESVVPDSLWKTFTTGDTEDHRGLKSEVRRLKVLLASNPICSCHRTSHRAVPNTACGGTMKFSKSRLALWLAAAVASIAATAFACAQPAQSAQAQPNTTLGYGDGKVLNFVYTQNFDCIDQPKDDLNFNGILAESDPGEMQTPICQVGIQPTINPPGQIGSPRVTTEPLYVLVPMFSVDNDQNPAHAIQCDKVVAGTLCGNKLGSTLISLFGALPEGFKAKPLVYTQCPGPGFAPGTCTMHASRIDLGPVLVSLGLLPGPVSNVFVPTPNHSHVVLDADITIGAIWWQVIPVLVMNQADWPTDDGGSGLTSVPAIRAALKAGTAVMAPSNFFLFFSSAVNSGTDSMQHMH